MSINLDAALLKKMSSMTLRARHVAEGFISGLHQSPFKGASLEFAQHRQYSKGDELRHIDWKVYGRTDRLYVKQFQEETNLRGYSVIDTSSSMGYGSAGVTKLEYASYLSAAITYLMIKQRDSAGLITFAGSMNSFIPPRNFKAHLNHLLGEMDNLLPAGKTDFMNSFTEIGKIIKKRSLLVVFSDLMADPDRLLRSLKFFPYLKNDLVVFHILDREEIELGTKGYIQFTDMESGLKIKTVTDVIRKEYRKNVSDYLRATEMGLRSHNIDYYRFTTDTPLDRAVSMFMEGRKKIIT